MEMWLHVEHMGVNVDKSRGWIQKDSYVERAGKESWRRRNLSRHR